MTVSLLTITSNRPNGLAGVVQVMDASVTTPLAMTHGRLLMVTEIAEATVPKPEPDITIGVPDTPVGGLTEVTIGVTMILTRMFEGIDEPLRTATIGVKILRETFR